MSTPERRPDCDAFVAKEHPHQCGDCQTDGHYLCIGCKRIAPYEDMELGDNRARYYAPEYALEERAAAEMEADE